MQLTDLKGIGKTRLEALHAAGICSLRDLLYAFPVRYRDVSAPVPVAQAQPGETACLMLARRGEAKLSRHGKLSRVTCTFADETGQISACWFNQPWMREHLNAGTRFTLYGRVEASGADVSGVEEVPPPPQAARESAMAPASKRAVNFFMFWFLIIFHGIIISFYCITFYNLHCIFRCKNFSSIPLIVKSS